MIREESSFGARKQTSVKKRMVSGVHLRLLIRF